jgi:hypothetical protein
LPKASLRRQGASPYTSERKKFFYANEPMKRIISILANRFSVQQQSTEGSTVEQKGGQE